MLICLCSGILLSVVVMIRILFNTHHQERKYKLKMQKLQSRMATVSKKNLYIEEQLEVLEQFQTNLKAVNTKLSNLIFDLNFDLFSIISNQDPPKRS